MRRSRLQCGPRRAKESLETMQKPGHPLRDLGEVLPAPIRDTLRDEFSITTAEELVGAAGCSSAALREHLQLDEPAWQSVLGAARAVCSRALISEAPAPAIRHGKGAWLKRSSSLQPGLDEHLTRE